jgi:hypothetical protein
LERPGFFFHNEYKRAFFSIKISLLLLYDQTLAFFKQSFMIMQLKRTELLITGMNPAVRRRRIQLTNFPTLCYGNWSFTNKFNLIFLGKKLLEFDRRMLYSPDYWYRRDKDFFD